MTAVKSPKKLIEVSLPLDDINKAAIREKSIRHGHPSTLHLWWARRPLAAARAVLFAQMVNDPGYERYLGRGVNKEKAKAERERLFDIIRKLVQWENTNNEDVLAEAREEIWKSWRETCALNKNHPRASEIFNPEKLPAFHDPFAGGGALPLEAQRLGLESYASDLNPVAVLINKAMIEIPPKFAGKPPVNPESRKQKRVTSDSWNGAQGLAEDVRYYGKWMRDEAEKRIGHLYPKIEITEEMVQERPDLKPYTDQKLTVIAWIWARTVKSSNPAFANIDVPLVSSFSVSTKKGKEVWVDPVIRVDKSGYDFVVRVGGKPKIEETVNRRGGICLMSNTPISFDYIRTEGKAGRIGERLMLIVAEGEHGRIYLSPTRDHTVVSRRMEPAWKPQCPLPVNPRDFKTPNYGMSSFADLFTPRQLVALTTFSDLIQEGREIVKNDSLAAGMSDDCLSFNDGGTGAQAYADAIAVYLACAVDKASDYWSSICSWHASKELIRNTFGRQAIPMVWDYAETNPFSDSAGNILSGIEWSQKAILRFPSINYGRAVQSDAQRQNISTDRIISTDPPYYDNISYAELSDFFYIWLRHSLKPIFPNLFSTLAVPKEEELVATPYRHGSKKAAEKFFLDGMTQAMHRLAEQAHPAFPVTIYYAFKQSETDKEGTSSTGWDAFLEAVIQAGFTITGTWPMRTELGNRMIGMGTNALASSVVLVCQKHDLDAPTVSRRDFLRELKQELAEAFDNMTGGAIAPVDFAQAIIGPGMGVFSKYSAVLEANGDPMSVHDALILINRTHDEYFSDVAEDFDSDTRFCISWFEDYGWGTGKFGDADVLARARGTSVDGVREAGVLEASRGNVRLLKPSEYPADWSPEKDNRIPVWEALHNLIRTHQTGGNEAAGELLARMLGNWTTVRQLAYRLYTLCERKGWAEDARTYNELIISCHEIEDISSETASTGDYQYSPQTKLDSFGK